MGWGKPEPMALTGTGQACESPAVYGGHYLPPARPPARPPTRPQAQGVQAQPEARVCAAGGRAAGRVGGGQTTGPAPAQQHERELRDGGGLEVGSGHCCASGVVRCFAGAMSCKGPGPGLSQLLTRNGKRSWHLRGVWAGCTVCSCYRRQTSPPLRHSLQAYALVSTGVRLLATNQAGSGSRTTIVSTQGSASIRCVRSCVHACMGWPLPLLLWLLLNLGPGRLSSAFPRARRPQPGVAAAAATVGLSRSATLCQES